MSNGRGFMALTIASAPALPCDNLPFGAGGTDWCESAEGLPDAVSHTSFSLTADRASVSLPRRSRRQSHSEGSQLKVVGLGGSAVLSDEYCFGFNRVSDSERVRAFLTGLPVRRAL